MGFLLHLFPIIIILKLGTRGLCKSGESDHRGGCSNLSCNVVGVLYSRRFRVLSVLGWALAAPLHCHKISAAL